MLFAFSLVFCCSPCCCCFTAQEFFLPLFFPPSPFPDGRGRERRDVSIVSQWLSRSCENPSSSHLPTDLYQSFFFFFFFLFSYDDDVPITAARSV